MDLDAPLADAVTAAPPAPQWVVFSCARRRYAIALARAREILTPQAYIRLPGAGTEVAGLVGVRSRVLTCFDLGEVLEGEPAGARPNHRILLVDHGDRVYGLLVDAVLAVAGLAPGAERAAGAVPEGVESEWQGCPVLALDVDRLCDRLAGGGAVTAAETRGTAR